ncbi:MAG: RraA family protein [Chloroflexota bacterium]
MVQTQEPQPNTGTSSERAPIADASDPFALAKAYQHLRLSDVSDALDALGRNNVGLVDPSVRPLWEGIRFWGVALTMRMLPANKNMPPIPPGEVLTTSGQRIWWGQHAHYGRPKQMDQIRPGHVVVTSTGRCPEAGIWGSANGMNAIVRGAVGIVTDGYCRDTDEVILQKTPICARGRGRTITPGRVEFADVQVPVELGGVLVRPGDLVGADGDGVIVVPVEVAANVIPIAATILIGDMKSRRRHYQSLGLPPDPTVAVEVAEAFYSPYLPA